MGAGDAGVRRLESSLLRRPGRLLRLPHGRGRDRARPARRPLSRRGRGAAVGARRPRVSLRGDAVGSLPSARHRLPRRGGRRCRDLRSPLRAPARASPHPPGGRRDRGARRRQRHAPDQPHPQAGVPCGAPARGRGLHALRQLVELPAAQARRGPAAGRGRARGDVLLPDREARGVRRPAAVQPPARARSSRLPFATAI